MTDSKLTDNEIIKALECCKYEYDTKCELCCYNFYSRTGCRSELRRNALDLINHLQAENEELKLFTEIKKEEIAKLITKTKAEAYKECIEKVKEYIDTHEHLSCEECECVPISKNGLDNLLKELVGDK